MAEAPARRPCGSCPYQRDVPSGVWAAEEYAKLPEYDRPMADQPVGVFLCHRQDGRVCGGWAAVHDMEECLAVRLAAVRGTLADPAAVLEYATDVELWASGAEAAEHGLREIAAPGDEARPADREAGRERPRRREERTMRRFVAGAMLGGAMVLAAVGAWGVWLEGRD